MTSKEPGGKLCVVKQILLPSIKLQENNLISSLTWPVDFVLDNLASGFVSFFLYLPKVLVLSYLILKADLYR